MKRAAQAVVNMAKRILKRQLKRVIPWPGLAVRKLYYFPADALDRFLGQGEELKPPRSLRSAWGGWFPEWGAELVKFFVEHAGLRPDYKVLDVGCGVGSLAVALAGYLDTHGRYEGFDIVGEGIEWCQNAISTRYPNFRFQLLDVFNGSYNPRGKYKASEYRFPYPDTTFDLVYLGSVFTHMLPPDFENYLSEVARVLKRRGRCVITFFS